MREQIDCLFFFGKILNFQEKIPAKSFLSDIKTVPNKKCNGKKARNLSKMFSHFLNLMFS